MPRTDSTSEIALELQRLQERDRLHQKTLASILAFSTRLTKNSNLHSLYHECNALAQSILSLDFSTLMILSDDGKSLIIRDAIGFPASMIGTFSLVEGQGLSTYVVVQKKAAVVADFQSETRFEVPPVVFKEAITSAVSVPMMLGDAVFGVMIGHTRVKRLFSQQEIDLYQSLANQAAVAIQNAMHFASLQDNKKRFRALIDRAGDAIFMADKSGKLVDVNERACHSLGYTREELLTKTVFDIDPQAEAKQPEETLWKDLSADQYITIHSQHRRKDDSLFPVEIRIGLLPLQDTDYVLGFARDISERETAEREKLKLQEQLIQAQKMESIGTLAGGIAHDFNNILTPILGYLDLAMLKTPEDSEITHDLSEIRTAAERARDMVKQILTFARCDNNEVSPIQVHLIVKEALKLLRSSIPATIEIKKNINPHCGSVLANPTHIHQILMNLCTNAYYAMKQTGGTLEVSLSPLEIAAGTPHPAHNLRPGQYLHLVVRDTGHGFNQAIKERIFDPYFTTKRSGEGTGMGLAVVHGVIQQLNGHIEVESEPGKGTTFAIYLPVLKNSAAPQAKNATECHAPKGTERIMLVDDEESVRNVIKDILHSLGYDTSIFSSPTEALGFFATHPEIFDLVITDMTMPKMTGDLFAKEIMTIRPDIPVILCTGFSDSITEESAKTLGIKGYLPKPITINTIGTTVRKILDQA